MKVRAVQNIAAGGLGVVLVVVLGRAVLLSEAFGALSLVATAAAVAGLGVLLTAGRSGAVRTAGSAVALVGLGALVVAVGLTILLVMGWGA